MNELKVQLPDLGFSFNLNHPAELLIRRYSCLTTGYSIGNVHTGVTFLPPVQLYSNYHADALMACPARDSRLFTLPKPHICESEWTSSMNVSEW